MTGKFKLSKTATAPHTVSVARAPLQAVQSLSALVHPACVVPVVAAALQVITMLEGMQSHREKSTALQKRISYLAVVASKPWIGKNDEDIPEDTRIMIHSLRVALESSRIDLEEYSKAPWVKRLIAYQDIGQLIKSCSVKLDFAMQLFQIDAFITADIKLDTNFDMLQSELDRLTISSTAVESDTQTLKSLFLAHPQKPDLFFGRDNIVDEIAQRVVSTPNARLAILGDGGIGKTSVACAILAHRLVAATFDGGLTWISCTGATSLSLFVELIADSLNVPKESQTQLLDVVAWLQTQKGRHLLVFDNFETPWDIEGHQADVEQIVCALVAVPQVSILITMRARDPPSCTAGLEWTRPHLAPLPVLSLDAARRLYLEIDPAATNDISLDPLLLELDCVPLVVTLMAKIGLYGDLPTALLSRWRTKIGDIKALNLDDDQLNNVKTSVELSINSNLMKRQPQAERLLRILAILPAGARRDILPKLAPSISTMEAILPLLQTSLVSFNSATQAFHVLSPIRRYMLQYRPMELSDRLALHEAYFDLLDNHPCTGDVRVESIRALSLEEANLEVILMEALPSGEMKAVRAAIAFGHFQYITSCRLEVIETCIRIAQAFDMSELLPRCFKVQGDISRLRCRYEEAGLALNLARDAYELVGNTTGAADCLWSLGDIARMRGQYDEARLTLIQAQEAYERAGNVAGATCCLTTLGDILRMHGQYEEAEVMLRKAQDMAEKEGSVLTVADCLRIRGIILMAREEYGMAESTMKQAQEMYEQIGFILGAAHCARGLGQVCYSCSEFDKAESTLKQAQETYERIGNVAGVADCLRLRGTVCIQRRQYNEAVSMLTQARREFERAGDVPGVADSLWGLGTLYIARGWYGEAESTLKQAQETYERLGNVQWVAKCLKQLEKVYIMHHTSHTRRSNLFSFLACR